nr:F-box only protein 8-like [Ipomoea batatas]
MTTYMPFHRNQCAYLQHLSLQLKVAIGQSKKTDTDMVSRLGLGFEIQLSPSPLSSLVSAFAHISAPSRLKKMDCSSKKLKKMDGATSTSIASLPQEIILKILTTLPPKSALSFRCTSKFFHSFIPQPHFAFRILFWVSSTNLNTVGYTTEESHGRLKPSTLQCSAHELQRFKGRLAGSSFADGKLCLFSRSGEITILDLSTRQHISLPQTFVEPEPGCRDRWTKMNSGAALGFDPVSKRYKVLKSELYGNITHQYHQGMLRVLTLGVDESWRAVTTENSFLPRKPYASTVFKLMEEDRCRRPAPSLLLTERNVTHRQALRRSAPLLNCFFERGTTTDQPPPPRCSAATKLLRSSTALRLHASIFDVDQAAASRGTVKTGEGDTGAASRTGLEGPPGRRRKSLVVPTRRCGLREPSPPSSTVASTREGNKNDGKDAVVGVFIAAGDGGSCSPGMFLLSSMLPFAAGIFMLWLVGFDRRNETGETRDGC